MAASEEVPPYYTALVTYFTKALDSLESLSGEYRKVTIVWEDGKPTDYIIGSALATNVRNTRVRFSETLGSIYKEKSETEMFDEFMKLYQDEKANCATAAQAFSEEETQLKDRITGSSGFRKLLPTLSNRTRQVWETESVEKLLSDAFNFIASAQRQVDDAALIQRVQLEPQIDKTKTSWRLLRWSGPITEWSYENAVEPWVESMKVLVDRRVPFGKDEFPALLDIERQRNDVPKTELIQPRPLSIISRSRRHLGALKELHRIAILRVRFSESDKDEIQSNKINTRLRNMAISLRVLYYGLREYGKLVRTVQEKIRVVMTNIVAVTLMYEYWRQWGKYHPMKLFDEKRVDVLSNVSPQVTGAKEWIDWIVEKTNWYTRKEFDDPEYGVLRDIVHAVNEEARQTQGQEQDIGWSIPIS